VVHKRVRNRMALWEGLGLYESNCGFFSDRVLSVDDWSCLLFRFVEVFIVIF
jgi:hypothetical protein